MPTAPAGCRGGLAAGIGGKGQQRVERLGLGFETREPGSRKARRVVRRAFALLAGLDLLPGVFDRGEAAFDQGCRCGDRGTRRDHHRVRHRRGGEARALALGLGQPRFQPAAAVGELALPPVECRAAGCRGGARIRSRAADLLRPRPGAPPLHSSRTSAGDSCRFGIGDGGSAGAAFFRQPGERRFGIGEHGLLAPAVKRQLRQPPLGLAARRDDPRQLLLERAARLGQLLQFGRRRGVLAAQRGQGRVGFLACEPLGSGALLRLRRFALGGTKLGGAALGRILGGGPAGVKQQRLVPPDFLAEPAIALGLTRLLFQDCELRRQSSDHVVEPWRDCPRRRRA